MKPMLLTYANSVPSSDEWIYEAKYDGYRCILHLEKNGPILISRNNKELTHLFPEIIQFCNEHYERISDFLPITLDGEIVYLVNNFQSNFSIVQSRGKMRAKKKITEASKAFPCNLLIFDILQYKGNDLTQLPLIERKSMLATFIKKWQLPLHPNYQSKGEIQSIEIFESEQAIWNEVKKYNGEGVIAKKKTSLWEIGKRTNQWLKVKNWLFVTVVLTKYDQENGYFNGAVFVDEKLQEVTIFQHGLTDDEIKTLSTFFKTNGTQTSPTTWEIPPSICVDVACISLTGDMLREPRFEKFRFDVNPFDVTWKRMLRQLNPIPEKVEITHPDKPIWPAQELVKDDYIYYLQKVSPYFLPFLNKRLLTSIRFPHGVPGESFYQKNAPDYIPSFIETKKDEDIEYIVCNDIETLLWLGNQLAIEFHIPFQTIDTKHPTEIVFDLDPPSVEEFSLAIEAALRMKAIFDNFKLHSFIKTSGGKGLQIYIPLPRNMFSYEETRIFTEFVCQFLCEQEPRWFTIERLKKNRGNKLYLDYIQHAEGKTIVAPYSPRGNAEGLIATPLQWNEVNDKLNPKLFPIRAILERINSIGDPFKDFFKIGDIQNFKPVLNSLKELTKKK